MTQFLSVKTLFRNILKYDLRAELYAINKDLLYLKIVSYFSNNTVKQFEEELNFLISQGKPYDFPYRQLKTLGSIVSGIDLLTRLPFVVHNTKKLFFPKSWDLQKSISTYRNLIEGENILGGNFSEKAPHQYQTSKYCVKKDDVVLELGAAEGLFSLDVIDLASQVYVFEPSKKWSKALRMTFKPYSSKVKLIQKYVSNRDTSTEIKLSTSIDFTNVKSLFVKMDIEGFEKSVLEDNRELFSKNIDITVSCCTYHRDTDADDFKRYFESLGYETEFSDGYVIFSTDPDLKPPYFRKGLIRARKQKSKCTTI